MEGDHIKVNKWLLPVSWLYGLGVRLRNKCFEWGILKSRSFSVPIISVGNITVGGSGKTPHVEYLVEMLKDKVRVAVLSRGYKRKSKGYQLASPLSTVSDIGDEPLQMKKKYPNVHVAVDANRCEGIDRLTQDDETKDTDVILLDDAYQHRYVKPGINILLVDYHRLIIYDKLLPAGRLREPKDGKRRADMVIITKCPEGHGFISLPDFVVQPYGIRQTSPPVLRRGAFVGEYRQRGTRIGFEWHRQSRTFRRRPSPTLQHPHSDAFQRPPRFHH